MSNAIKARTTTVTIFQGDDLDTIESLRIAVAVAEMKAAEPAIGKRMVRDDSVEDASVAYDAAVREAAARGVGVELRALPRKQWREIVVKHEPREDQDEDQANGFNVLTIGDDLVPASLMDRTLEGEFLDSLTDADFSRLVSACVNLNRGGSPDPKVRLSSAPVETGAES